MASALRAPLVALAVCLAGLSAACGGRSAQVVRVGEDLWVSSARGGKGVADEAARRREVTERARLFCAEQGLALQVDSLVSSPSRPDDDTPSASLTFRCVHKGDA
jgi:hypothetical protein